jgi:hypothetical protein
MRGNTAHSQRLIYLSILAWVGCGDTVGGPTGPPEACGAEEISVVAMIVHDARQGAARHSAVVTLTEAPAGERPSECDATVSLIGPDGAIATLEETQPSQYEAGWSEIVPDLPTLSLTPGAEHELRIDLGSDGTDDITGRVTLSDIDDFRVTRAMSDRVEFGWQDAGVVPDTTYYVQVSDQSDFLFPDNFATGWAEATTALAFGTGSEFAYFDSAGPHYARIQAETAGTVTVDGRFLAMAWPPEPIIEY